MKNKWIRRIVLVLFTGILIPFLFFAGAELILRLSDYGYEPKFFIRQTIEGKEYFVNNYKFSWRFFPKPMARLSASIRVPVHKEKNTIRIFVFGESAAMGDPEPSFSFSRQLEAMLGERYPEKKIELYNTAITAINSNVILPIAKECLELEPDLLIVYAGNNEVIGPYGLSAALSPFFSTRWVIKCQIELGRTRIGQFFRGLTSDDHLNEEEWRGMSLFTKNKITSEDPDLQIIYDHYRSNIDEICQLASNSGVKVVLSTIITNERDCAPFVSVHNREITSTLLNQWEKIYHAAITVDTTGHYVEALDLYRKAYAIDSAYAELNFRMAKCYDVLGSASTAAKHFIKAQDDDALRFRCDSRMNNILRDIARRNVSHNIFLSDAESAAKDASVDHVPGKNLLYEHVHLNFDGNNLLSRVVLEQTEIALGLENKSIKRQTVEYCKKMLAYTAVDEKRIGDLNIARIQMPPFTNQYSNRAEVASMRSNLDALDQRLDSLSVIPLRGLYEAALAKSPDDWFIHLNYLRFLFAYKYYGEAAAEAGHIYRLLPYEYLANINMGITQQALHQYGESEHYFSAAIRINPFFSEAYKDMAMLFQDSGEFYKVEPYLLRGRSSMRELGAAYNGIGIKFARQNNADSAIKYFRKAVGAMPGYKPAQLNLQHATQLKSQQVSFPGTVAFSECYNKGNALFRQRNFLEAIEVYKKAITINPSFPKTYNNLAIAFAQIGKLDEAITYFSMAIKIDPGFIEVYPNLAKSLEAKGRLAQASEVLKKAVYIRPDPELYSMLANIYLKTGHPEAAKICLEKEKEMKSRFGQ